MFQLGLRLHGETRPRNGFQARAGNGFAGQFADAVSLFLDALEGFFDLVNRILVGGKQAQGEIAVKIIRARIGHVQAVSGQFLGGFLGQTVHLVEQLVAQFQEMLVILLPLGLDLFGFHRRAVIGCVLPQDRGGGGGGLRFTALLFVIVLLRCHKI